MRTLVHVLLIIPAVAVGQVELKENLSPWAAEQWPKTASQLEIELFGRINPFLQRGDFDGDGKADIAVLVQGKLTRKVGVLILHRNGKQSLLGAGQSFGNGGDDFSWMSNWWVEESSALLASHTSLKRRVDALVLSKEGSASALIVYKRDRFEWQQQGD